MATINNGSLKEDSNMVKKMLALNASPNARMDDGQTALHVLSMEANDNKYILDSLIATGADIEAKDKNDETPLCTSVRVADARCVAALLAVGANPNVEYIRNDLYDTYKINTALGGNFTRQR